MSALHAQYMSTSLRALHEHLVKTRETVFTTKRPLVQPVQPQFPDRLAASRRLPLSLGKRCTTSLSPSTPAVSPSALLPLHPCSSPAMIPPAPRRRSTFNVIIVAAVGVAAVGLSHASCRRFTVASALRRPVARPRSCRAHLVGFGSKISGDGLHGTSQAQRRTLEGVHELM